MSEKYSCTSLSHGNIDLYLPNPSDMYFNASSQSSSFTFSDGADLLTKYPKLDKNTTIFVANASSKTIAQNLGFSNVINCQEWKNDRIIFSNGNYLSITAPYTTQGRVDPVLANGTVLYTNQIQPMWADNDRVATCYSYYSNIAYDSVIDSVLGVTTYNAIYINFRFSDTYSRYRDFYGGYLSGVGQIMPSLIVLPVSGQYDIRQFWNGIDPPPTHEDPYSGAGDSTTGGGDGTFDGSSDPVPVPNLPSVGAQDSGFITLFAPTAQQMKDLAHFMWVNPVFDLSAFKKLFADPMDCILGLSVVPVTVPTSGAKNVNIGNLITTVTMNVASQQYIEVDCGTVTMDRFFGSYLDFEPYTKISLFLPYCGTHSLNMDDIAGKTIGIVYHIDILTGSCIAFVKCGDSVLYEFNGACGSNIPVNSLNFASTIENAIRIAVNIGTTVATAGASAPITGANAATRETARKIGTGVSLAGSTAEGALSMKPNVSRSGALGGGVGILGHQIPYFIITRPRLCKPAKQDFFQGYPSFIQTTIGDLIGKGFTSFTNVIISGQYLTDEEETELESILESGVYL